MIHRHDSNRRHLGPRATVAGYPALAAYPATPLRRPPTHRRSGGAGRHRLPAAHRHPLAAATHPPAGLRQPGHLLAPTTGLAARWRVAAAPPPPAGGAEPPRPAGLVAGQPGLDQRTGKTGGCPTGPNPTDRGKPGSKYHLLVDQGGIPLAVCLSAANTHDSMLLEAMVDAVAPVKGPRGHPGRPRKRPAKLHGDKGYDYPRCRRALRRGGITPRIAAVASSPISGWAATGTWWSGRWRGWWATGGCKSATSAAPTSCLGSCTSPAR
jgi:hypothetical protein